MAATAPAPEATAAPARTTRKRTMGLWAIAGAGDDIVTKGFVLMLGGIPIYVGMRWWQKRQVAS
jgi:hypothetical protein